jgi:excisionase family DNA binding protein
MELLTVKEVARRLRVSASLVYQLVDSGKLGCHRIGNGRGAIRIRPEDVTSYLQACREDPCGKPHQEASTT